MLFAEIWGALFYLLNKISFSRVERSETPEQKRRWRILAWIVYLIGLPAILIFYGIKRDWMVVFVEAGGGPAMAYGLVRALRGKEGAPKWLDTLALVSAFVGIGVSLYDLGGFNQITQLCELGLVVGFLFGTYLLAKERPVGYLFFMLMIGSNLFLLWIQSGYVLFCQQIISMVFVVDAFRMYRRKARVA